MKSAEQIIRYLLIGMLAFGALSAIAGAYGLLTTNGLGMPLSYLEGSWFDSYLIPGLILCLVVGGTQLIAAFLLVKTSPWEYFAAAVAGFGLIIWIFGEMYITGMVHWLQVLYFALGTAELVLVTGLLGVLPNTTSKRSLR